MDMDIDMETAVAQRAKAPGICTCTVHCYIAGSIPADNPRSWTNKKNALRSTKKLTWKHGHAHGNMGMDMGMDID